MHIVNKKILEGIIVEVEAYSYPDDPASHAFKGLTIRNKPLFGAPGHAYVYKSYGIHTCFNVVSHLEETAAGGVLVRAVEPISGIELMCINRGIQFSRILTSGPGNVCRAFGITMDDAHVDLTLQGSKLFIAEGIFVSPDMIETSSRIGLTKGRDKQWRFYIKNNKFVSRFSNYAEL